MHFSMISPPPIKRWQHGRKREGSWRKRRVHKWGPWIPQVLTLHIWKSSFLSKAHTLLIRKNLYTTSFSYTNTLCHGLITDFPLSSLFQFQNVVLIYTTKQFNLANHTCLCQLNYIRSPFSFWLLNFDSILNTYSFKKKKLSRLKS